jgi:hypothetical protein
LNPLPSYLLEAAGPNESQWSVIYSYASQQVEFFTGDPAVRQNSGLLITDSEWHHIAYRKGGPGASTWDKFLDGVKTPINGSISFSIPAVANFFAFNSDNNLAPCQCGMADVLIYNSARADAEIQALAAGIRPNAASAPLLYWPLAGVSSPEPDASGNNHPGTVHGNFLHLAGPP